jgi:signal peptidase II
VLIKQGCALTSYVFSQQAGRVRCGECADMDVKGGTYMVYILITLALFLFDANVKNYIEQNFRMGETKDILKGRITINKHHNKGFSLNVLENRQDIVKKVSAILLGIIVLFFIIILGQKRKCLMKLGLSLSIGGAASNVWDRFKRGYVVDYFSINIKPIKHIVLNLADIFIFIGSFILFLSSFLHSNDIIDVNENI